MIARLAVLALCSITFCLVVADALLITLPWTTTAPDSYGLRGIAAVLGVVITMVGAAIAVRHPRNTVGLIFLVSGLFATLLEVGTEYGVYALVERGGLLPGGEWALWLAQVSLCLGLGPISTYLLLIFPNGQPPSARWRPVAWYTVAAVAVWTAATALVFAPAGVRNPVSLGLEIPMEGNTRQLISAIILGPVAILCGVAFVHRFRTSRGVERQQLKWMAYAVAILVVGMLLLPFVYGRKPLEIAQQLTVLLLPVAAAVSILRYRLYDIDVLINRTLVYGALTAVLGLAYVVSVLLSQEVLRGLTAGSDIAVAGSTLLVVALFQPIRARVQEIVDRRFYRARYDAARTIDAFSTRLRGDYELDSVRADLIAVIHDTMHPAHASVWLRRPR